MAERKKSSDAEALALAERLRDTREYLNLSQQFVAEQTDLPRSAISDIERGARRVDSLELKRFARLYRYPVTYFLGDEGDEQDAEAETVQALARAAGSLPEEDQKDVLRFAAFLRHYGRSRDEQPS